MVPDLQEFYNDKKRIELAILAGQYKTVAYDQNSLKLPQPEGSKGLMARQAAENEEEQR